VKSLLHTVSAVGREFSYYLIKRVTNIAEQELLSQLSVLKDSELLYERGIYPESTYIFKHALTQEVAYNGLLLKRRKDIHEEIGKAIEAIYPDRLEEHYELLAYHYGRSANAGKALEYLGLANHKAIRLNAMEEAKAYFDEAMALLDALPETEENRKRRISLLVNQWEVILLLLEFPEYYDLLTRYESMASGLGSPKLLGSFYARLGHCEYAFGHFDQAIQTLTKAAELCEAAGNAEDAGYAYAWLEWSYLYRGDYDRVLAVKKELLRTMEQRFNLHLYLRGLVGASRAYICLGLWNDAVEEAEKALKVAKEASDQSLVAFTTWTLSMAYTWRGDLGRGVEYGELAFQKAVTPADKAWTGRGLGWSLCRDGVTNRGIKLLGDAAEIVRASGHMASKIPTACILGAGYWLAGKDDKARQTLEEGLEMADRCGTRYYQGWAQRLLGEIALKTNPTQAASHFEKSIAIFRDIKAENELALAYAGHGRLHKQQGEIAQAREYLTKALEIFEGLGTLIEPDKVREELTGLREN
jgi:tetratricopeptide (TPR) repeat protein